MKGAICLSAVLLFGCPMAMAATYIVDINHPQASDNNPGTPDRPFKSISKAAAIVQPGDMVIVKAGVYREAVRMMRGGTPQKPIVFLAEPIGSVIVKGSEVVKDWEKVGDAVWRKTSWELAGKLGRETGRDFVFRREQVFCDGKPLQQVERREQMQAGTFWVDMDGKALYVWLPENANPNEKLMEVSIRSVLWTGDYLTPFVHLKGFRFEHCANRAQQGAIHLTNAYGWLLENCSVEWANGTGLKLDNCASMIVRRCQFNRNGQLGIGVGDGLDLTFEDCETSYNNWKGYSTSWEAGGVKVAAAARRVRFLRHKSAFNRGSGIWFDYAGYGHEIIGCVIHDNTDANAGIQIEVTFGVLIANNICYRNTRAKGAGSHFGSGILLQQSGFCRVYHNTCVENDNGLTLEGAVRVVLSAGNEVVNNIFAFNREFQVRVWDSVLHRVTGWTFPLPSFVPDPEKWARERLNRFDHNLYFSVGEKPLIEWGGAYNPGTPDKGQYRDLKEFATKTGQHSGWAQEAHGIVADPLFVNPSEGDFRLRPDSPAIDKGIPTEVKTDITGNERPKGKAPDLGAYEQR
jgi:hypothetical protein